MTGNDKRKPLGLFIWALVALCYNATGQPDNRTSHVSECANYLYISGASNVNQFDFRYRTALKAQEHNILPDHEDFHIFIPVKEFKPSNPLMYGDFLALMKESDYPQIKVTFSKLQFKPGLMPETFSDIKITIAGITRIYKVRCSVNTCSDKLFLSGKETIRMSDFNLKPPQKLMGFIKVNNEIEVNFGFMLTFTDSNNISATF